MREKFATISAVKRLEVAVMCLDYPGKPHSGRMGGGDDDRELSLAVFSIMDAMILRTKKSGGVVRIVD